jgi:hypothetical protein
VFDVAAICRASTCGKKPADAADALQILHWDTQVPDEMIDVGVDEGWLTLSVTINYRLESNAAHEEDVAPLQGVVEITNKIEVITRDPHRIASS